MVSIPRATTKPSWASHHHHQPLNPIRVLPFPPSHSQTGPPFSISISYPLFSPCYPPHIILGLIRSTSACITSSRASLFISPGRRLLHLSSPHHLHAIPQRRRHTPGSFHQLDGYIRRHLDHLVLLFADPPSLCLSPANPSPPPSIGNLQSNVAQRPTRQHRA